MPNIAAKAIETQNGVTVCAELVIRFVVGVASINSYPATRIHAA